MKTRTGPDTFGGCTFSKPIVTDICHYALSSWQLNLIGKTVLRRTGPVLRRELWRLVQTGAHKGNDLCESGREYVMTGCSSSVCSNVINDNTGKLILTRSGGERGEQGVGTEHNSFITAVSSSLFSPQYSIDVNMISCVFQLRFLF